MKSKVYFVKKEKDLEKLWKALDSKLDGKIAIKTHFGERGNKTYPNPKIVKFFASKFKNPTLIECNVLYTGERMKAESHKKLAKEHGFDFASIDICDGKTGEDEEEIKINLKNFKTAKIGKNLKKYDSLLSIAHFKGHGASGFGGAIKNIGMGLASRAGKLDLHSKIAPSVNKVKCDVCGICVENCSANAITLNNTAEINPDECIGCAKCIAVCPNGAINIPWEGTTAVEFQERLAEYTYAILKSKKAVFINLLVNITKDCDCMGRKMEPFIKDIGFLSSHDIVALDKACYDLVKEKYGKDPFKEFHDIDSLHQLEYGEKIGLGNVDYELIKL